jgi:hypothetical protein
MKMHKKSTTHKLTSGFDKELMNILMSDLKAAKAKAHSRLKI